ncbi:MAG TPA: 3-deoxy-D-manno-octulosonic acid transferase [Anaerohalosphaeraceae bacterium]|nr:3-deoxy-D-manno-octulosonic acid transferase [Anaerohalosphaeraceae bacterium]HQG05398.1 3-deoxy-D-manno-octulosonic acid transferase [Anaerohalosphaeraceae bacterium]HQI06771.1 3-deoxy-D-manno-octulosonic acid transferase [Anaerohalosphaeraceae bacterium]HQJ67192.1 3-deoxy-D-manno-octulosonic acid transferase [Anaerohalosphaeraceae bacterium]
MRYLIDFAYIIAMLGYSPKIVYRFFRENRYKSGWSQRLGKIRRRDPERPCLWLHAVSVGEVNAARTLIDELRRQMPEYEIVLTSTTDTGLERARSLYEQTLTVSYFPFDFSWSMSRAFEQIRPDAILLMELEVWPNLARFAFQRNIPVIVVNGRLSDKSFPRYRKIRRLVQPMFSRLALVLAQTEEYAKRFMELGCPAQRVRVVSSLKYDTARTEADSPAVQRLAEQIHLESEPLWVAGGTGPQEEQIVLEVFSRLKKEPPLKDLRLAVIPRKPERFDEAAALIEQSPFSWVRYSRLKEQNTTADAKPEIILGDTMGDLNKFYALASVVFVGRTLTPLGGSDMMEPAALGKCTLFGPYTFNFKQTVQELLAGQGAIEVADKEQLFEMTRTCLLESGFARQIAENGRRIILRNKGATQKTIEAVREVLAHSRQEEPAK